MTKISNVQVNGGAGNVTNEQIGEFTTSNGAIDISSGLIMGSGDVKMAEQSNTSGGANLGGGGFTNVATDADLLSLDINGNGIFDPGDRTVIGNGNPKFTFGLTNTFSWRRFDLNFFFHINCRV